MRELDSFLPLVIFAFSSLITPGPNNIIIAAAGINFGFKRSLPTIWGVTFGFSSMAFFVALGIAGVFTYYPVVQKIMNIFGFVLVLYLAWKIASADMSSQEKTNAPPSFWQMVAFQWVNPKAWVMSGVATAAFTITTIHTIFNAALIGLIFLLVSLPCQLSWGIFGAAIGNFLRASRLRLRIFNCAMAILMIGAFIPMMIK